MFLSPLPSKKAQLQVSAEVERGVGLQVGLHASSSTRGAVSLPHLNSATSKKAAAVCKESVLKVNNALPVNNAV